MKNLFLIFIVFFVSCGHDIKAPFNGPLPDSMSYYMFRHIKEIYRDDSITFIRYEIIDTPISAEEKDTLIKILQDHYYDFKVTTDNQVLIRGDKFNRMSAWSSLNNDLVRRMKK